MKLAKGLSSSHHLSHSKRASGFFCRVTRRVAFTTSGKVNDAQIQVVTHVIVKVVSSFGSTASLTRCLDSIIKGMKVCHTHLTFFPVSFVSLLVMIRTNGTISMIGFALAFAFIKANLILTFRVRVTDPPDATFRLNKGTSRRITKSTKGSLVCTIVFDMILFAVVVSSQVAHFS